MEILTLVTFMSGLCLWCLCVDKHGCATMGLADVTGHLMEPEPEIKQGLTANQDVGVWLSWKLENCGIL